MSTIKLKLIKSFVIIIIGLLTLGIASYIALKTSVADYKQQLTLSGLDNNIEIIRDKNAIPHIFATTLDDAYFGLGFAHAQDRLWQLELTRAASSGSLSEIFGEATLSVDKLTRTVNSAKIAQLTLQRMSDKTKTHLLRYIDGINQYIKHRTGVLPVEFLLFSVEPKLWTLEDTAGIFTLVALGSDNWQKELQRAAMQQHLSAQQIDALYPSYPIDGPVTHTNLTTEQVNVPKAATNENNGLVLKELSYLTKLMQLTTQPLIAPYPASNTWVIDGSMTKSGKPLLASDPHGPIKAPADYYLAHLSGPDFDITGIGYPGMPAFAIGHNRHIAWGLTDILADMSDLYAEKLVAGKPGFYLSAEGKKAFTTREEIIKVKGQDDVIIQVRSTEHGPVISDVVVDADKIRQQQGDDIVLALSTATFSEGNTSGQAFMSINLAHNWQQFKAAMSDYEMAQNMSYADSEGNIGIVSSAKVPLRKSSDGFMITPGWKADSGIIGYLGADKMPTSFNPKQGYLANANNKTVGSDYPYFLTREDEMPFRAKRIVQGILSSKQHTVNSMIQIQSDVVSQAALQLLPIMLNIKPSSDVAADVLERLSNWNGKMDKELIEPLLYMAWERELNRLIYEDELGDSFNDYFASRPQVLTQLLMNNSSWCDNVKTNEIESCDEIIGLALKSSLELLTDKYGQDKEQWTWGNAHQAMFANDILTHVPLVNILSDVKLASDGGPHTVNNAKSDYTTEHPFEQNYGPRYRQIIDLSDLSNSRFMITPGVSGNFLSPYYKHLAELWRDNQYIQLESNKTLLLEQSIGTTQLVKAVKQ